MDVSEDLRSFRISRLENEDLIRLIDLAKREDLGPGDITATLLSNPSEPDTFRLEARAAGVFAGCEVAPAASARCGGDCQLGSAAGDSMPPQRRRARLRGVAPVGVWRIRPNMLLGKWLDALTLSADGTG